jgi:hypothetical protein
MRIGEGADITSNADLHEIAAALRAQQLRRQQQSCWRATEAAPLQPPAATPRLAALTSHDLAALQGFPMVAVTNPLAYSAPRGTHKLTGEPPASRGGVRGDAENDSLFGGQE